MAYNLQRLLYDLNACDEAIRFSAGKTIETALAECSRGDWILWLGDQIGADFRLLTLAKARCAKTVFHLMHDPKARRAVEVAEKFGLYYAGREELNTAREALISEEWKPMKSAHWAAIVSVDDTMPAHMAAYWAASAEQAAVSSAFLMMPALIASRAKTAQICRETIGDEIIGIVNVLLEHGGKSSWIT